MITLVKVVETCMACPAQWDAWDADGQYYYLRYRSGKGTVEKYDSPDPSTWGGWPAKEEERIASFEKGDRFDGMISLADFCEAAGVQLSESCVVKEIEFEAEDEDYEPWPNRPSWL